MSDDEPIRRLAECIREVVDAASPLTDAQREQLAALLGLPPRIAMPPQKVNMSAPRVSLAPPEPQKVSLAPPEPQKVSLAPPEPQKVSLAPPEPQKVTLKRDDPEIDIGLRPGAYWRMNQRGDAAHGPAYVLGNGLVVQATWSDADGVRISVLGPAQSLAVTEAKELADALRAAADVRAP